MPLETSKKDGKLYWVERDENGKAVQAFPPTKEQLATYKQYQGPANLLKLSESVDEAEANPPPPPEPTAAENFVHGLTTNEPPRGVAGVAGRAALPTVGAMAGAPLGVGVGSVPTAGLGAAAGESIRQSIVSWVNPQERMQMSAPELVADVVKPVAIEGAVGAAGQGVGMGISKGVKAAYNTLAPQVISGGAKVPLKSANALVKGQLKGAKTVDEAGKLYEDSLKHLGIKGLDKSLKEATGKKVNVTMNDFAAIAEDAATALDDGTITPQKALWGRQAIHKIKQAAKLGRDEYLGVADNMDEVQAALDDYLENVASSYGDARKEYAKAKTAEQFDNWLARNKDGSVAVGRWLLMPAAAPLYSPKLLKGAATATNAAAPYLDKAVRASGAAVKASIEREKSNPLLGFPAPALP